jgi:hypothetical protein
MMEALKGFDRITALGVLSRAALAVLSSGANPSAQPVLEHEAELRGQLIQEVANRIGVSAEFLDQNTRDQLSDALDEEAETLDLPVDTASALTRLSERGELPSDVFEVVVSELIRKGLSDVYGDAIMEQEHQNILLTVRSPATEEHFGPSIIPDRHVLVSLFGRQYPAHPRRAGFYHLVAGERSGTTLTIQQSWRIYEDEIDLIEAKTLIGAFSLFAEKYGLTVKSGDHVGRFIPWALVRPGQNLLEVLDKLSPNNRIFLSYKVRPDGFVEVAFAMCINLDLYSRLVHRREALGRKT